LTGACEPNRPAGLHLTPSRRPELGWRGHIRSPAAAARAAAVFAKPAAYPMASFKPSFYRTPATTSHRLASLQKASPAQTQSFYHERDVSVFLPRRLASCSGWTTDDHLG